MMLSSLCSKKTPLHEMKDDILKIAVNHQRPNKKRAVYQNKTALLIYQAKWTTFFTDNRNTHHIADNIAGSHRSNTHGSSGFCS